MVKQKGASFSTLSRSTISINIKSKGGLCGCCVALKPRYSRLVDKIFQSNPEEGLDMNHMAQLMFYAVSSPDKLDKIGHYLEKRLYREIHRHKIQFIFIGMEACDQLLKSCHAQSLNLFVESFLKIVQKLLECDDPELQILATNSFVKFANIEEDTPSYHRRYDFFVHKFSSMCHNNNNKEELKIRIRTAGLLGLQGVVRKTVSDDLQDNIWDPVHMDKIIPSLLFNMNEPQREEDPAISEIKDEEHPSYVAENVFRDLMCRASFGSIRSSVNPVLIHLDNHNLWQPNNFARKCFQIIMYSVQAQHSYLVIQMLMLHLDKYTYSNPMIKVGIIEVLCDIVIISVGGTIGPSVLEIFNNLLQHLQLSLDNKSIDPQVRKDEKIFEESIINTIGQFADSLPDFQKIDIMIFVLTKFPQFSTGSAFWNGPIDSELQKHFLKTILKVAITYKTVVMQNAFPHEFLHPLLQLSQMCNASMRIIVQKIFQTLIDRHGNSDKLKQVIIPKNVSGMNLKVEKCSRQDILFMKKHTTEFFWFLYENMKMHTNTLDNYESLYCTMALIYIEMGEEDMIIELIRLSLDFQLLAVSDTELSLSHRCAIHSIVAAYLNLIGQLAHLADFSLSVYNVINIREHKAPHLLPEFAFNRKNNINSNPPDEFMNENWLFDQETFTMTLSASGSDTSRLLLPLTEKPRCLDTLDADTNLDVRSIASEGDSNEQSPGARILDSEITVESLKRMLDSDDSNEKKEMQKKQKEIINSFRNDPFDVIVAKVEAKSTSRKVILDILEKLDTPASQPLQTPPEKCEIKFPDFFVY